MFIIPLIKPKLVACGANTRREILFVWNNYKSFHKCFTHMHYKIICLIISLYVRQKEHRGVFLSKVKSIFLRYNLLWSIFYRTLRWKLFKMTTLGNIWIFFSSEFSFGKTLPKYFRDIGEYILPQYPWIHPRSFPDENEAYEISSRWKGLYFLPPQCVLVIWVFPRDILNCWCSPVIFLSFGISRMILPRQCPF